MGACWAGFFPNEETVIKSVYFHEFIKTLPPMTGKTVAITGCTSGTGYICAKVCSELGAKVIMLNRPSQRADDALKALQTEVPGGEISLVHCDLMSFESVCQAGQQLKEQLGNDGLDVLCCNAGVMALRDMATVDGCDVQMQTNHLSHFLLVAEVWALLDQAAQRTGEARVVNHSSVARKIPFGKLEPQYFGKNGGNLGGDAAQEKMGEGPRWKRYQQTKLANVAFTYALHDHCQAAGSKVKSLVAHPGVAATQLFETMSKGGAASKGFTASYMSKNSQSQEDGSMGLLKCCCASDVKSKEFYGPEGVKGEAKLMMEEALADETSCNLLWEESAKVTGAKYEI
jgi:NAD(P)-dependent dehydrogenase (short-subunit alcohol dehydrogenase family)